jgi:uncharacterized RDD family membrane protein YckC
MDQGCPKCGFDQIENDECPRCRVIVSKYRQYLETIGSGHRQIQPPAFAGKSAGGAGEWQEGDPAGFWIRAAAYTIDSFVFTAALLPFMMFVLPVGALLGQARERPEQTLFALNAAYNLTAFVAGMIYNIWMHGRWGQTLGKMATGVQVLRVDGSPIGYGVAFLRYLASLLSSVTLAVGFLMVGFRSDKRSLHDLIVRTRVIKVRRPEFEGRPAGFWMRFVALMLDGQLLVVPIAFFGVLAAIWVPVASARGRGSVMAWGAFIIVAFVFLWLLSIVYTIWMHGKWGQTLGKMAIGVKVTTTEGLAIGYGTAFLRWIGSVLSAIIFMVGYLIAGFRSDKRSLHDLIAGTRVVWIR